MAITALKSGCKLPIIMSNNHKPPNINNLQIPLIPPLTCIQFCNSLTVNVFKEKTTKDSKNDSPKAYSALIKFKLPQCHLVPTDHLA